MFFKDVIGQDDIKRKLIRSVEEDRISHAIMFSGSEGVGKLALAIAFAQYISCRNPGEDDSCGVCPSCIKYEKLVHPDLHFSFPVFATPQNNKPKSDDFVYKWREMVLKSPYFTLSQWLVHIESGNAQGMIYDEESKSISQKFNLKSFESDYKILIMWLPEKMNKECSNKLLKLIEEPLGKTVLILITENENAVIPTIRSRTQPLKIPLIDRESMRKAIEANGQVPRNRIENLVRLANGNYLAALEYIDPDENAAFFFDKFQEMMRLAYSRKIFELTRWADEMAGIGRDRQKAFFSFSLRMIREYFMMNMNHSDLIYLTPEEKEWGENFSPFINERNLIPLFNEFESGIAHIESNGNARIIFFDTALRVVKLIRR